jgi:hypothetical protein
MLEFEKTYFSDGTELANGHSFGNGPYEMCFDGRYLWVTSGLAGVFIYEFFGAASEHEPIWANEDALTYPRFDVGLKKKLRLVTVIKITNTHVIRTTREPSLAEPGTAPVTVTLEPTVEIDTFTTTTPLAYPTGNALNAYWVAKVYDKMFVTSGGNFDILYQFDIASQRLAPTEIVGAAEELPDGSTRLMNSNLCESGGRLWFCGNYSTDLTQDGTRQKVYAYDPRTFVKSSYDITQRPTTSRQMFADGKNGFVYLTLYNDVGVAAIDNVTGAMTYIRINRLPTYICSDEYRDVFVSSINGMLTKINANGVFNDYSSEDPINMIGGGGALEPSNRRYFWAIVEGKLKRIDLNTKEVLEQYDSGNIEDWHFNWPRGEPTGLYVTPDVYYENEGQGVTVAPYMFVTTIGGLVAFRINRYLYRTAFAEMDGVGAVSSGPEFYFGE